MIALWFPPRQISGHDLRTASNPEVTWTTSPATHCLCKRDQGIWYCQQRGTARSSYYWVTESRL